MKKCQKDGHNQKEVIAICSNINCKQFRACCFICLKQDHSDHIQNIIDLSSIEQSTFEELFPDIQKILENVKQKIIIIQQDIDKFIQNFISNKKQLNTNSLEEIHENIQNSIQLYRKIIDISNTESIFYRIINQFGNLISQLKQELSQKEVIQKFDFSFSLDLSPSTVQLVNNNKQAQSLKYSEKKFLLSDKKIPKNEAISFSFNIIRLGSITGLGICHYSKLSKDNKLSSQKYNNCHYSSNAYFITSDGYSWSHLTESSNQIESCFQFSSGNKIEIIVNPIKGLITWKNITQYKIFSMIYEKSDDLVPCLVFFGSNSIIEID